MGRYVNWDDVVGRYPELGPYGDAAAVESSYIHYAETEVDARLGGFYTTPFSSDNLTAQDLTIDLVYTRMYGRQDPDKVKLVRKDIDDRVRDLRDGVRAMVTTSGTLLTAGGGSEPWSTTDGYTPVFGVGDIRNFHPDSSQLYDEELNREY